MAVRSCHLPCFLKTAFPLSSDSCPSPGRDVKSTRVASSRDVPSVRCAWYRHIMAGLTPSWDTDTAILYCGTHVHSGMCIFLHTVHHLILCRNAVSYLENRNTQQGTSFPGHFLPPFLLSLQPKHTCTICFSSKAHTLCMFLIKMPCC